MLSGSNRLDAKKGALRVPLDRRPDALVMILRSELPVDHRLVADGFYRWLSRCRCVAVVQATQLPRCR